MSSTLGTGIDERRIGKVPYAERQPLSVEELRQRPTVSVEEAGRVLGIGRNQAYEAINRGELPGIRVGRRLRVPSPALLALLGVQAEGNAIEAEVAS